jgi:hypothetical protein
MKYYAGKASKEQEDSILVDDTMRSNMENLPGHSGEDDGGIMDRIGGLEFSVIREREGRGVDEKDVMRYEAEIVGLRGRIRELEGEVAKERHSVC